MKAFSFYINKIMLGTCLLSFLHTKAQTVLKLESKTSQQGIEFDVPIKLQIPLNNNSKPVFVGIYKVPKSIFKPYQSGTMNVKTYYSKVLGGIPKSVPLSPNDKFEEIKDNSAKYLFTLSNPAYLNPNTHYVIGVFNPFILNTKYSEQLRKVLIILIEGHNKLPKPIGQVFSNEELFLHIADSSRLPNQTILNAWNDLKKAYASDSTANLDLLAGIALYDQLYGEVLNDFGYTPIPEKDAANLDFYKVYESIIPLIKLHGDYNFLTNFNGTFPYLGQDSCLYNLLKKQLSCFSCDQQLPSAGILKDTSGLIAFVIDLLQNTSDTKSFIDDQITTIKVDSISKVFDKKDQTRLQLIFQKLEQTKIIMEFMRVSNRDACDTALPKKMYLAYNTVKAIIETRDKEAKLKQQFDSLLAINESYIDPNFFSLDTYVYNVDTRYGLRLTPDIGLIDYGLIPKYDYNPGHVTPYVGIQINFRYTKSNIPFNSIPGNKPYSLRHFSAFLGISAFSIKQGSKVDNLFGKSSLLLGLGYRFIPEIRMVIGTMLVKKIDPNPLISSTKTGSLPFIGLSFDANKILSDFLKAF